MGALIQGFTVPKRLPFYVNFPLKRESPHSLGLVNFPAGLADSICHLQVKFLGEMFQEIQITDWSKHCKTWIFQGPVSMIFGLVVIIVRAFPKGKNCKLFFFWPCSLVLETISVLGKIIKSVLNQKSCEPLKFTCYSSHWLWHFFLQIIQALNNTCTVACSVLYWQNIGLWSFCANLVNKTYLAHMMCLLY